MTSSVENLQLEAGIESRCWQLHVLQVCDLHLMSMFWTPQPTTFSSHRTCTRFTTWTSSEQTYTPHWYTRCLHHLRSSHGCTASSRPVVLSLLYTAVDREQVLASCRRYSDLIASISLETHEVLTDSPLTGCQVIHAMLRSQSSHFLEHVQLDKCTASLIQERGCKAAM